MTDRGGRTIYASGDLDPNGDVRDAHSVYVHNGELPLDKDLFNLQSKFITRMVRGGEREQVLAVNYSPDPLPFLRPFTRSSILTGRPGGARKHRQTIPPLKSRWAEYKVKRPALAPSAGPYTVNVKLICGMVPVNLVDAIKEAGFDYGMSPRQVADEIVARQVVLGEYEAAMDLTGSRSEVEWQMKEPAPSLWEWEPSDSHGQADPHHQGHTD